jgi:hypothetical protein
MARLRVMCVSARADFDNTREQSVVRCVTLRTVEEGYCLDWETDASAEEKTANDVPGTAESLKRNQWNVLPHIEGEHTCKRKATARVCRSLADRRTQLHNSW